MPYLHYETDEGRQKMMDAVRDVRNELSGEPASPTHSPNTLLLQAYLPGKPRIHPRRTLDQFFYHGLDTSARDRDQVVYRYCESHGMYLPIEQTIATLHVDAGYCPCTNSTQDTNVKSSWSISFGYLS